MNCFEFKKIAMSDPYSEEASFVEHQQSCPDCQQYLQGILAFDNKLVTAMSGGKAPDDFKAQLKLRHVMQRQEERHQRFRWMSYAAGIMLAITAAFFGVKSHQSTLEFDSLYQQVVEHVEKDTQAFTTVQATAQARMQSHLASYAGVLNVDELPGLRFSQLCPIGKHKTWHAVVDNGLGMVTVIYFKGNEIPEYSGKEDYNYVKTISMQNGSIMLLGETKEAVYRAEQEIDRSLSTLI